MAFSKYLLVALVAALLMVHAGCAPAEDAGAAQSDTMAEPSAATETTPAAEAMEPKGDPLVGTTWAIADYTVTFEADGVLRFNSGSEGTWTRGDDTITLSVVGEEMVINVEGDALSYNGTALEQQ